MSKHTIVRRDLHFSLSYGGGKSAYPGHGIPKDISEEMLKEWETCGYLEEIEIAEDDLASKADATNPAPQGRGGPWRHNPKQLKGKTLEQLNVMVAEIDADMQPFDTVEEAVAQLTLDHN